MIMTGNDIRYLMRINKVTIRQLAAKMNITLKRIRLYVNMEPKTFT